MPFEAEQDAQIGPATNPLLELSGLVHFDVVAPEHITPAVDTLLLRARRAVDHAARRDTPATWDDVVEPLDDSIEQLSRSWGAVSHLNAVVDTAELRAQYNANLPKLTAFWTELSQNEALFEKFKGIAASAQFARLSASRRTVVEHELRDFRLGGAELPPERKQRLKQVRERLAQRSTRFAENVLDATNAFALFVDEKDVAERLAGVPSDVLQMFREAAEAAGRTGCKITLHYPSYMPVLQYAHDRELRRQLYRAYTTRASEFGPPDWDNTAVMIEILQLRREQAQLLGYRNFAEVSLVPKMADSPADVLAFLRDLNRRAKPHGQRDMAELREFARRQLGLNDVQAWDVPYASERLRESRYAYSEQELRQYFPEPTVLAGLFRVIETLFSVAIRPDAAPTWHPDVKFFRIETRGGRLLGQFYLDLYAREHKQGGAWQDDARCRRRIARADGSAVQTPISFLTCNLSKPVGGRPALFTHDEVLTLFHEFGHGLHHMLTEVDEVAVSGIRGVEWDAVELPSQFMENFAWEWEVLQLLTSHVETGAKLPRALYDKLIAAKNFQSGMHTARQLVFGLLDMRLHGDFDPAGATPDRVQQLLSEVRQEAAIVHPPEYNRTAHSFTHIFSGGYAAGYYSYKWAEVLSADAYAAFEERGTVLDPHAGGRFHQHILAVGGSRPAMESFVAFRGRKPTIDALLRHSGMSDRA
jgi:oligopeptidase A